MNDDITVWLDMDGVLVGFDRGYMDVTKGLSFKDYEEKFGKEAAKNQFLVRTEDFWANLPWEDGGKEVYETAKHFYKDVRILSSTGTKERGPKFDQVTAGKKLWIQKQGLSFTEIVIVPDRHDKQKYATPMGILVDDLGSNIREWDSQGGTGVLHNSRNYNTTLVELGEYSKPISFSEIAKRASHME